MQPKIKEYTAKGYEVYTKYAKILIIPALLLLFLVNSEKGTFIRDNATLQHTLDSVALQARTLTNRNGQLIKENTVLAASEGELKNLSAKVFDLTDKSEALVKKVNYLTKVSQEAKVQNIFVPYDTAYAAKIAGDTKRSGRTKQDSIAVPQIFSQQDSFKYIHGTLTKTGVNIDSLALYNELYQRGATQAYGFLNLRRRTVIQAINTSPYFNNSGIATYQVPHKANAWNRYIKPVLAASIGATAVYLIKK